MTGEDAIEHVRAETDTVLLNFSGGKDSLATWLAIRPFFERIEVVYYYPIPGLGFVEDYLQYIEEAMGQSIHRLPWPDLYNKMGAAVLQPFGALVVLEEAGLPEVDLIELRDWFVEDQGLPTKWTARGFKSSDSFARRRMFKDGGVFPDKFYFDPIFDWKKEDIFNIVREHGVLLSADYLDFGRSFEGPDGHSMTVIKEKYPEDYEKILKWYPMARLYVARLAYVQRRYEAVGSWKEGMDV